MSKPFLRIAIGATWIAANLAPLALLWLLWPRLGTAKAPSGDWLVHDVLVASIFPLQHSVWTQPPVKRRLLAWLGPTWERPLYSLASGAALVATVVLWRSSDVALWPVLEWSLWPLRVLFVVVIALETWCAVIVGSEALAGTAQLRARLRGEAFVEPGIVRRGPYRYVRHPIAMCQIVSLWLIAAPWADRVLLAALWTVWIVVATALEDRRAARREDYAAYRGEVGVLGPKSR